MLGPVYFYAIVGGGLAGLQLALRLKEDVFFKGKKIAIIDPSFKITRDKTWCFWEKGHGRWDALITTQWQKGKFISNFQSGFVIRRKFHFSLKQFTVDHQNLEQS